MKLIAYVKCHGEKFKSNREYNVNRDWFLTDNPAEPFKFCKETSLTEIKVIFHEDPLPEGTSEI